MGGAWKVTRENIKEVVQKTLDNIEHGYKYMKILKYDLDICQYNERKVDVCGFCADICLLEQ